MDVYVVWRDEGEQNTNDIPPAVRARNKTPKKKQKGGNRSQGKTPGNTKRSAGDDPLTHVF